MQILLVLLLEEQVAVAAVDHLKVIVAVLALGESVAVAV